MEAVFATVGSLVWLVVTLVFVAAQWRLFAKAGQPGWACLVPIYNVVKLLQITGRSPWWLLGLFIPLVNVFVGAFVIIRLAFDLAAAFGRGVGFGFGLLLLAPVFVLILAFGESRYVGRTPTTTTA